MKPEEATLILSNMIHDDKAVYGRKDKKRNIALAMAIEALKDRPHGEWRFTDGRWGLGDWECTLCHNFAHSMYDFCPNCGADMRREGEAE